MQLEHDAITVMQRWQRRSHNKGTVAGDIGQAVSGLAAAGVFVVLVAGGVIVGIVIDFS